MSVQTLTTEEQELPIQIKQKKTHTMVFLKRYLSKRHHRGTMKTASRHQKALPWRYRLHACLAVPVLCWVESHPKPSTMQNISIDLKSKTCSAFFCSTSVPLPTVRENHRCGLEFEWWRVMQHFFTCFCDLLEVLSLCQPFLTLWVLLLSVLSMTLASRLTVVNCLRKARKGRLRECVKDCLYRNKGERMSIRKKRCGKAQTLTDSYSTWNNKYQH